MASDDKETYIKERMGIDTESNESEKVQKRGRKVRR
jgi:hypothetical protein